MAIGRKDAEIDDSGGLDGGRATQQLREAEKQAVFSRRGVLWKAGIASAVGAVALTGLDQQRAQAATGGAFLLGEANAATTTTALGLTSATIGASWVMSLDGTNATTSTLHVTAPAGGTAIDGQGSSGVAISGVSTSGAGVAGTSTSGPGAIGTSSSGAGLVGSSATGDGVQGTSVANGKNGVVGTDTSPGGGTGVSGVSTHGLALSAKSGSGGGLQADAPTFHLRLANSVARNAPIGDKIAHQRGDVVETTSGDLWLCTTAGTPGTWRKLGGPATAGALHILPVPVRIYDSRPGFAPNIPPQTPLSPNVARTLDLKGNSSHVPAGAVAALINLLVVNGTSTAPPNLVVWANGATKPTANSMVWDQAVKRASSLAVTALDSSARCQVAASVQTDIVVDVVGYYQ